MGESPARFSCMRDDAYEFEVLSATDARTCLFALGLSRSAVARCFVEGQFVKFGPNGMERLVASSGLSAGDLVAIIARRSRTAVRYDQTPVPVLYEDPFVIAVEKPQGLLVHSDGTGAATLTDRVAFHVSSGGPPISPQALQRLDFDTTGIVLFSKTEEWQPLFDGLIAGDGVDKRYLAVVEGVFPRRSALYRDRLGRDRHDSRRMRIHPAGQECVTFVRRLGVDEGARLSLLEIRLGTGRRHQIRVHLSAHGYPIVNDPLYGVAPRNGNRLMLHAWRESFVHPILGEPVDVRSGWPERFSSLIDRSCFDDAITAGDDSFLQ